MNKHRSAVQLILLFCLLTLLASSARSHDAFYPHHRDDLDALNRKQEIRGVVLISTIVFLMALGGVLYIVVRNSKAAEQVSHKTEQDRLDRAAHQAAEAACATLTKGQHTSSAIHAALAAYADTEGVAWHENAAPVDAKYLRCKIGSDVVIVGVTDQSGEYRIEVNASCDGVDTNAHVSCAKPET